MSVYRVVFPVASLLFGLGVLFAGPLDERPVGAPRRIPTVRISFPENNSLVRADVPIFGAADCPNFRSWRLECAKKFSPHGEPIEPQWRVLAQGTTPIKEDLWTARKVEWDPGHGAAGNIFTWCTGAPSYPYTTFPVTEDQGVCRLRLTAQDPAGNDFSDEITVQVADVFSNMYGGLTRSPDGVVEIELRPRAMQWRFFLVGVTALSEPAPKGENLEPVGLAYEIQPPGIQLEERASVRFSFDRENGGPIDRVGVYWYDSWAERWVPSKTDVEDDGKRLVTTVSQFPRWRAIYALFRDNVAPAMPALLDAPRETSRQSATLSGKCEPLAKVSAFVGPHQLAEATADDKGYFRLEHAPLNEGDNVIRVYATDAAGNRSEQPADVLVHRKDSPPTRVQSFEVIGPDEPASGDAYLLRLIGQDSSPATVDATYVELKDGTDKTGTTIELVETGANTGVYEGRFQLDGGALLSRDSTDLRGIRLEKDGDNLLLVPLASPSLRKEIVYRDHLGPPAPKVTVNPQYHWVAWTFEEPEQEILRSWKGVGGALGASVSVAADGAGNRFLKLTQQQDRSHLGLAVPLSGYAELDSFPLVSFDYLIPEGVGIDLYLTFWPSSWRTLKLNNPHDCFQSFGKVEGIVADGKWHHVDINLLEFFRPEDFPGSRPALSSLEFGCYVGHYSSELSPGRSSGKGSYYCIDNFQIYDCPEDGVADFSWECADPAGILGYGLVIDQNPQTVPPKEASAASNSVQVRFDRKGRWFLHVRAVDGLGNWGQTTHYPLTPSVHSTRSLSSRAEGRIAEMIGLGSTGPETLRDQVTFAARLRKAGKLEQSARLEHALSSRVEETQRVECLRRSVKDFATAADFASCQDVLFEFAGVSENRQPTTAQLVQIASFLRQLGPSRETEPLFRRLAELQSSPEVASTILLHGLARQYVEEGAFDRAEKLCKEKAVEMIGSPVQAVALGLLALCYSKQARIEELATVCQELKEKSPHTPECGRAVVSLVKLLKANGRFEDAIDEARSFLRGDDISEARQAAVLELLRATWERAQSWKDIERQVASLLDADASRRAANLRSLRIAILALEADGDDSAAAVCQALTILASAAPEAEWANRRLLKRLDATSP